MKYQPIGTKSELVDTLLELYIATANPDTTIRTRRLIAARERAYQVLDLHGEIGE